MIPKFKYHPDPLATGSVIVSDKVCRSCGEARGFIYTGSAYCEESLSEDICPFCISDGSAAEKFDATFSDDYPLLESDIDESIVDEVTKRTPGYSSWQQEVWLTCCDDACEFHGDAPAAEMTELAGEALSDLLSDIEWPPQDWKAFVAAYEPAGNPAVYKFTCRHCKRSRYGIDHT